MARFKVADIVRKYKEGKAIVRRAAKMGWLSPTQTGTRPLSWDESEIPWLLEGCRAVRMRGGPGGPRGRTQVFGRLTIYQIHQEYGISEKVLRRAYSSGYCSPTQPLASVHSWAEGEEVEALLKGIAVMKDQQRGRDAWRWS